ncbi:T9SS type A sorting domain-containing protein [Bacteroidota bacterium]
MKLTILTLFIICFSTSTLYSQYANVRISNINQPHETSIMINPFNTDIIVAAANIYTANSLSGYFYSSNAGLNWSGGILTSNVVMPFGDVVVIVDTSEHFYILQNSNYPSFNVHLVQKSTDFGVTWSNGVTYGDTSKMQDKPWGCVDLTNSIYRNNIYITWSMFDEYMSYDPNDSSYIMFIRSTDAGLSFSTPLKICEVPGNAIDSSNTVEGAVPCVGPNGEIYVSWSGPLGIVFDRSTDGGYTWLDNDIFVAAQPGGWTFNIPGVMRCNGFPVTACDISGGPYNGTIYINWSDQRNGTDDTDIWLIKSNDGGSTWSSIKRVNDDPPPGRQQFFNWMAVDQITGYIYIVFYDRRNYTNFQTDVYLARSTDGGDTFENVKISQSPFYATANLFLGDYINISAHNNKIRPIWTRIDGSYMSIWTAIIDTFYTIGVQQLSSEIPESHKLHQNYPNPFNPTTNINFDIPVNCYVSLSIYNILGEEVTALVNENLSAGKYKVEWDASGYPSGMYYCRIESKSDKLEGVNFYKTMKMVLIK